MKFFYVLFVSVMVFMPTEGALPVKNCGPCKPGYTCQFVAVNCVKAPCPGAPGHYECLPNNVLQAQSPDQ
ncbi:hypothetical protein L596_013808 [Steinernema carpocapsae]|uniref:Uncharacterized protein n=1 Tax=Steinernema carpocapsae TaxID=34508 RepID=A0A4V6A571_STECR|nr:hypothetical protein L596_013808 [Steinernema carpocapsae]